VTSTLLPLPGGQDAGVPAQEDEQLVRDALAGHRPAFEELVRRHADRLHAVVRRLVDSREEAEEVTQEAFLRAWRGLGRFEGDAAFSTWLYRIGVNEAHRRRERRPARRRETSLEAQAVEPRAPGAGPAGAAERRALQAALERAIAALPPDLRVPLVLRDVEGLSTAEAAVVMELGEAAFKSRLHRARLTVRAAVAGYLPDEAPT
jgi:RNA polymerase sigma-70 factor (ECF subfamily)